MYVAYFCKLSMNAF